MVPGAMTTWSCLRILRFIPKIPKSYFSVHCVLSAMGGKKKKELMGPFSKTDCSLQGETNAHSNNSGLFSISILE